MALSTQSQELEKLAVSRSLKIVHRFEDAVESGSTDDRPAFIELTRAIRNQNRGWDFLLVYDTSRIARRRYIAQAIKHEAKKRGVTILYARMPADLDPVAELVLESVFEAMDEAHSLMSREKGLAGMAENVRQGWRAGGRAPLGYRLESHATGAIREGKPVTKSKLVPGDKAGPVAQYLRARAQGLPRSAAGKDLALSKTSLFSMEWNALTYAGHTVWNVHQPSGKKRRPRAQWHINRNTHEPLITDAEAEAILAQLETSKLGDAISRGKLAVSSALLSGLLYTSEGRPWLVHGRYYRLRGRPPKMILAEQIEQAVITQVTRDSESEIYLNKLLAAARSASGALPRSHDQQVKTLEREKRQAAELALTGDSVFLQIVADRSRQLEALRLEMEAAAKDQALSGHIGQLTVESLKSLLAEQDPAKRIQTLVERITLEPDLTCRLHYRTVPGKAGWRSMASPRGYSRSPLWADVMVA